MSLPSSNIKLEACIKSITDRLPSEIVYDKENDNKWCHKCKHSPAWLGLKYLKCKIHQNSHEATGVYPDINWPYWKDHKGEDKMINFREIGIYWNRKMFFILITVLKRSMVPDKTPLDESISLPWRKECHIIHRERERLEIEKSKWRWTYKCHTHTILSSIRLWLSTSSFISPDNWR